MLVGLVLTLVWPVQTLAFAAAAPLAVVVVLAFGAGLGFTLFEVWWATALVRHIPPQALSRVSAYDWMGSLALLPLGFAIAGPLAAAVGARTVLGRRRCRGVRRCCWRRWCRAARASSSMTASRWAQPSSRR